MKPNSQILCSLIVLVSSIAFSCVQSNAQSGTRNTAQTFRAGLKSIAIPQPSPELVETGSDYRVVLELLAPNQNRLLAAFLLPEELKAVIAGPTSLSRYALVEVPRRAEFATVTPASFKQISDGMAQQFGASMDATLKDQEEEVNRRIKIYSSSAPTITMDKPFMLGTFFAKPDASSFGMILQLASNGAPKKMAAAVTIIRVQERVMFLYIYTSYVNDDSVKWVRTTAEQWTDAVLKANS